MYANIKILLSKEFSKGQADQKSALQLQEDHDQCQPFNLNKEHHSYKPNSQLKEEKAEKSEKDHAISIKSSIEVENLIQSKLDQDECFNETFANSN